MKRKVIGLLRSAKILIIRSLAQNRIMEIENFIKVDNLVFQKITEVGNLCRVMVFYFSLRSVICRGRVPPERSTAPNPERPPPMWGGANMLARQQLSRRDSVERRANVRAVVELPTAYKRVRERLHSVTVVTLQVVDQTGRDCSNRAIRDRFAALKRH